MSFHPENIDWGKIKIGLAKYETIMKLFHTTDVSKDSDFQRTFNGFYRVKLKSKEFYQTYYGFLELHKNESIGFQETIEHFFKKFGQLEASFSSKIIATIDPNMPIWDSKVLKRLKQYSIKKPSSYLKINERFTGTIKIYDDIMNWYHTFITTPEAQEMLKTFNQEFPNTNITDVKKIDFILWQTRDADVQKK